jgi:hypothetical protein
MTHGGPKDSPDRNRVVLSNAACHHAAHWCERIRMMIFVILGCFIPQATVAAHVLAGKLNIRRWCRRGWTKREQELNVSSPVKTEIGKDAIWKTRWGCSARCLLVPGRAAGDPGLWNATPLLGCCDTSAGSDPFVLDGVFVNDGIFLTGSTSTSWFVCGDNKTPSDATYSPSPESCYR